ncbi:hypothetical protein EG329_012715 [Mollisiaceae sp. DMI_Dod_QoI]|nr:hypothetical protein EG329_012715 [Helotiales sp. DMI_Dod_QoI]
MYTLLSLLTFAFLIIPCFGVAFPAEDWPPATTTEDWGHHHPTTTATTTDWLSTTAWAPTTAWVPPPASTATDSWSEVSEYTSYSLTTITISYTTCLNGCYETTTWSTMSVPVLSYQVTVPGITWLGAAPTTTWGLTLPTTTNGWTLLPGETTYGSGSVATYVSGSDTSLTTIGIVSYTSYSSYDVETFISGTSTSLSTIGIPVATPILVSGADEVQSGWSLGAAMVGAAGAALAML